MKKMVFTMPILRLITSGLGIRWGIERISVSSTLYSFTANKVRFLINYRLLGECNRNLFLTLQGQVM
jgi:hypothetical protein